MALLRRRWSATGSAAAVGAVLLAGGTAAAVVDAQLRSDAATSAVTLTADEREKLDDAGIYDSVVADVPYVRRSLILQNLASGGTMPERYVEVIEQEGENVSVSWGARLEGYSVGSWGGWQMKPVGIVPFAGLSVLIATGFIAAARREKQHPQG